MRTWNPTDPISKFFLYREALFLPTYGRLAQEADGLDDSILDNLVPLFAKMDLVREYFNKPIMVHVAYRPKAYNDLVGGARDSAHLALEPGVAACDFDVEGLACDDARSSILGADKLSEWGMRMEDRPGSDWVHCDTRQPPPGGKRFFLP